MSEEQAETIEVNLGGGVNIVMPKEDGLKYIADRDSKAKAFNELQAQVVAREASEKTAADELKLGEEKRIALEAAQKGQLDQLNNFQSAELLKRDNELLKLSIQSSLATMDNVMSAAVPDITSLLLASGDYAYANGVLAHKATGQDFAQSVKAWLESKPHYQASAIPTKKSGDNDGVLPPGVETITSAEYNKNSHKYSSALVARTLVIKD